LQPDLPFEFLVTGTAVSLGASGGARAQWQQTVRTAAKQALPEGAWLLTDPLAVTIYVFPNARLSGDVDNRIKPILDAMGGSVYVDDEQVERIVVQKFEPGRLFPFGAPSAVLSAALEAVEPIVYIRVTNDPYEDLS
jgi:crossover junction endodeoxyribonuclease RusA